MHTKPLHPSSKGVHLKHYSIMVLSLFMIAHAPTIAFTGIDCLDIDVQVRISAGFVGFTNVGPITRGKDSVS